MGDDQVGCRRPLEEWLSLNRVEVFQDPSLRDQVSPFPPAELMSSVSGLTREEDFAAHGTDIYRALSLASDVAITEYKSILDFGCGCGRLARMFKGHPHKTSGCDIDARHIKWIKDALPYMNAKVSRVTPPIPFPDNEFDAVISISIFTHLTEKSQDAFLSELHRVCRPGGRLFLTVHGARALERAVNEPAIRTMLAIDDDQFERVRKDFISDRHAFALQFGHLTTVSATGAVLPGKEISEAFEYGISFTTESYIRAHWSKWFEVLSICHGAIHDFQDIVVLAPRKSALSGAALVALEDNHFPRRQNEFMKVVVTGAAGLVGQNLVLLMRESGFGEIVAIDKQSRNLELVGELNPSVRTVEADLAVPGNWQREFSFADAAVILHAQITGKTSEPFMRNNVEASKQVYEAIRKAGVPFTVQVSSSVVNSVANDDYTNTKKIQERLFLESGLPGCVLRPTLMYGWFDPKHFGWLARFMERVPVFPIPGSGQYMRQPLYNRDFCRAILWCLEHRPTGKIYDLVGNERIDYIDIIREIKRAKGLKTPIVRLPYWLFDTLLRAYALVSDKPPFTSSQLKALTAGDDFSGVDIAATFGFAPTPVRQGLEETFQHPVYSKYAVERAD
jgi:nucleoside-diphosphate-sugar epimerase/SAM-dependent methyltransferase